MAIATMEAQPMQAASEVSRIMVVDDQPANLSLMEQMLRAEGYEVRSFPRGRMALASAAEFPPDLILLDINMPEMDGFSVCQSLKKDSKLKSIPVIFLSALSEAEDKIRAFQNGGVDYVTKPFQVDEIRARVKTHLHIHRLTAELGRHSAHLETVVEMRTRELVDAQARLQVLDQAKGDFLKLISHELRTPLNGLLGVSQMVLAGLPAGPEEDELREMFDQSESRLMSIIDNALLLTQIQADGRSFLPQPVSFGAIAERAAELSAAFAASREVRIETLPAEMGRIPAQEDLLEKAIRALLETAIKFSRPGQTVRTMSRRNEVLVELVIQSSAGSIPDQALPRFFDLFSVGESIVGGAVIGLDPAVAQRILALFGGKVKVENRLPSGIQLTISFPNPESTSLQVLSLQA
jgi:two-component system sensor histidine kinase/response regulator